MGLVIIDVTILLFHFMEQLNLLGMYFGVYEIWIMNFMIMDQCLILNMNLFWLYGKGFIAASFQIESYQMTGAYINKLCIWL